MPEVMKRDLMYVVAVKIRNSSTEYLLQGSNYIENMNRGLFTSYHWFNDDMTNNMWDNDRGMLTGHLRPGEDLNMLFSVTCPLVSGTYYFQLDIVEEGIRLFSFNKKRLNSQKVKVKII